MKTWSLVVALIAGAAIAIFVVFSPDDNRPAHAQQPQEVPQRPLVFVPGLLGSMLCKAGPDGANTIVWGTVDAIGQFPSLAVSLPSDDIKPCGLIREISYLGIFTQTVYGPFIDRLEKAGYRQGETLFIFDYDWRLSIFDNAKRLSHFIEDNIPHAEPIDIVAHSMGGLIARTYAIEERGAERIARMVSAGSPWRGSVQVFELLQNGWGLANALLGGLDSFRRTVISFPSTFELMPQYDGCCGSGSSKTANFDVTSLDAWRGLNWPGIDEGGLPDLSEIQSRQAKLRDILGTRLPDNIEEALVVGVDQRTAEHFDLQPGSGEAQLNVRTSWEGDGTVIRDSAALADRVIYPTSFATHDAILSDQSVQDFVIATLSQGPDAAINSVPVRERTSILTALGELVQLVGVAVTTDQPVYSVNSTGKLTVHLRLGVDTPVDPSTIALVIQRPGGQPTSAVLTPDPGASDPTNAFEQSFSTQFSTGDVGGSLVVTVTLPTPGAEDRIAKRTVLVVVP